jgi:hypothetical protein
VILVTAAAPVQPEGGLVFPADEEYFLEGQVL